MATDRLINSTQGDSIIGKLDDIKTAINNQSTAATATPLMDGAAAVGTSTKYARENHVHPTDTSRAANVMSTYAIDTARENITNSSTVQSAIEQLEYREETNKNNISLLTANTAIEDISDKITAVSGYTVDSLTKLYKQNNRVFGQIVIKKDTGSFGGAQENIARFNSNYRPKDIQIQGCFFGSTAYNAEYTGYSYIQFSTAPANAGVIIVKGYQTSVGTVANIHVDFVI